MRTLTLKIEIENRNLVSVKLSIVQARALYRTLQAIDLSQDARRQFHTNTLEDPSTFISVDFK